MEFSRVDARNAHRTASPSSSASDDDEIVGEHWPCAVGGTERRLPALALKIWNELRADTTLPPASSLNSAVLAEFEPYSLLLDARTHPAPPSILKIGAQLAPLCDGSGMIFDADTPASGAILSMIEASFDRVLTTLTPVQFEAECIVTRNVAILYRGTLLPFSGHGEVVDHVLCVMTWKELADPLTTEQIQIEIASALSPHQRKP